MTEPTRPDVAAGRRSSRASAKRVTKPGDGVEQLAGVGPQTAARLRSAGIETVRALACVTPTRYRCRRRVASLAEARDGDELELAAEVLRFRERRFRGRYRAQAELVVDGARCTAQWFHPVGGLRERARVGARVLVAGRVRCGAGLPVFSHPRVRGLTDEAPTTAEIERTYPDLEGLGEARLGALCRGAWAALAACSDDDAVELLPPALLRARALPGLLDALRSLHEPPAELSDDALAQLNAGTTAAHRRLLFESHFFLQLELLRRRARWRQRAPVACALAGELDGGAARERLRAAIPFEPTAAQWRAIAEIEDDMSVGAPMLRLLQGDVGSGKTVIAFAAALAMIEAGAQVAIMVPTELLADQHARTLAPWCARAGVRLATLTGGAPARARAATLAALADGTIDMALGTHALLQRDVEFARLGLVVIDEQHRFGVEQRALLRGKGGAPHLLVMTATPIPRSLALTAFGELEVSVLDERPPGRSPPVTELFRDPPGGARGLEAARDALVQRVEQGHQAYVVCPLVAASDAVAASDVEDTAARLRARLPGKRVAVVHGRVDPDTRAAVMEELRAGLVDVVVATTVIEVGVDVPEVRVILVEHAERFGLAQLHQLRGRVGRGRARSWCLLHTASAPGSLARARLEVLAATSDGFEVAERDLELRGPGEVFGTRQSGALGVDLHAGLVGAGVHEIVAAREAARALLREDPALARHPALREELASRRQRRVVYAAEAG